MEKFNVLLVDDEPDYFNLIKNCSEEMNFFFASDKSTVDTILNSREVDIILMDWNLGDLDGLHIVKELNDQKFISNIPVIMLTGKSGDQNIIKALNGGADDYVHKPFSLALLVSKIKANLRKKEQRINIENVGSVSLKFDDNSRTVTIENEDIILRKKEYLILKLLFQNPDRCFSREELNRMTSGKNVYISERCIDTYVRFLRTKMKEYVEIKTVRGQGYKASIKKAV